MILATFGLGYVPMGDAGDDDFANLWAAVAIAPAFRSLCVLFWPVDFIRRRSGEPALRDARPIPSLSRDASCSGRSPWLLMLSFRRDGHRRAVPAGSEKSALDPGGTNFTRANPRSREGAMLPYERWSKNEMAAGLLDAKVAFYQQSAAQTACGFLNTAIEAAPRCPSSSGPIGCGQQLAQRRHRQLGDVQAQRRQRVVDGAGDGGRRAEISRLARSLLPETGQRRRRAHAGNRNRPPSSRPAPQRAPSHPSLVLRGLGRACPAHPRLFFRPARDVDGRDAPFGRPGHDERYQPPASRLQSRP
jgi:hypothetical protein